MGNTASAQARPVEAEMDNFIINVSFCGECKCQVKVDTEIVGEGTEEVNTMVDQEIVKVGQADKEEKMTSFDDLISEGGFGASICVAVNKDEKETSSSTIENNDEEVKKDQERIETLKDDKPEINENESEAENNSSSGYGSPELSDKEEELDYEAFEKSLDLVEDNDTFNETETDSKCQEDILKDFFETTTQEENFLRRRDSLRRSFYSMTDLRKRQQTSSPTPSQSTSLDQKSLEEYLDKDVLEETLDIGPISEEPDQCPDDIAIIEDLRMSNKKGKSKLSLPVNMSLQNIKKTLLTLSPRDQRKGRKGRGKRTSSMIIIL